MSVQLQKQQELQQFAKNLEQLDSSLLTLNFSLSVQKLPLIGKSTPKLDAGILINVTNAISAVEYSIKILQQNESSNTEFKEPMQLLSSYLNDLKKNISHAEKDPQKLTNDNKKNIMEAIYYIREKDENPISKLYDLLPPTSAATTSVQASSPTSNFSPQSVGYYSSTGSDNPTGSKKLHPTKQK